jgi:hypothetical protein
LKQLGILNMGHQNALIEDTAELRRIQMLSSACAPMQLYSIESHRTSSTEEDSGNPGSQIYYCGGNPMPLMDSPSVEYELAPSWQMEDKMQYYGTTC